MMGHKIKRVRWDRTIRRGTMAVDLATGRLGYVEGETDDIWFGRLFTTGNLWFARKDEGLQVLVW
jgi:hypothetical protein